MGLLTQLLTPALDELGRIWINGLSELASEQVSGPIWTTGDSASLTRNESVSARPGESGFQRASMPCPLHARQSGRWWSLTVINGFARKMWQVRPVAGRAWLLGNSQADSAGSTPVTRSTLKGTG